MREYALERLDDGDELRARHLAYFVALAEEAEPELARGDQPLWFARLEDEYDNVRAALAFAFETKDATHKQLSENHIAIRSLRIDFTYNFGKPPTPTVRKTDDQQADPNAAQPQIR